MGWECRLHEENGVSNECRRIGKRPFGRPNRSSKDSIKWVIEKWMADVSMLLLGIGIDHRFVL
jgi:hypothetical protein